MTTTDTPADDQQEQRPPRRRLMVSIRIQGDDVGAIARSLIEMIHLLTRAEQRAPGHTRELGQISETNADNTRSYSMEVDDDHLITPATYTEALKRWTAAQADDQAEAAAG